MAADANNGLPRQLLLGFRLDDSATLENFAGGARNQQLIAHLQDCSPGCEQQFTYLWGANGVGKTHLLQALCQATAKPGNSPIYIPLADSAQLSPDLLGGLEQLDLICLDDLDAVAGDASWERALFIFYNRARDLGARLLVSAQRPPADLPIVMPDLKSRLQSGVVFQVQEPGDEDKARLLLDRAAQLGIDLSPATVNYVLQRHDRSVPALLRLLRELDRQSLEQKRRVTIPLVRSLMGW